MLITISGKPGTGKSTIAKHLAKKFSLKYFSAGEQMRNLAKEKNTTLLQIQQLAEKNPNIDKQIDKKQKFLKEKDNYIIDSRLSAHFFPQADIKLLLKSPLELRAKRIHKDYTKGKRNEEKTTKQTLKQTLENIKKIEKNYENRFKKEYKIDIKKINYDTTLQTKTTMEQSKKAAENIISKFLKEKKAITKFAKTYAKESNFSLNKNKKILDRVIRGLTKNKLFKGQQYCPCRIPTKESICPCIWHKNEINKKWGHCLCRLFFA